MWLRLLNWLILFSLFLNLKLKFVLFFNLFTIYFSESNSFGSRTQALPHRISPFRDYPFAYAKIRYGQGCVEEFKELLKNIPSFVYVSRINWFIKVGAEPKNRTAISFKGYFLWILSKVTNFVKLDTHVNFEIWTNLS